jgi:membrane-bound lytic murein transglycosylase MltF
MRAAEAYWGLDAPVSRFAAQIQAESAWQPAAKSSVASGLAQFTDATARAMAARYPELNPAAPLSPAWALRAVVLYDRQIYRQLRPLVAGELAECDRWAMTLAGYNGGPGWVERDRRLAAQRGSDPDGWWGSVELHSQRGPRYKAENRAYVRVILCTFEPRYIEAGWPGQAACR